MIKRLSARLGPGRRLARATALALLALPGTARGQDFDYYLLGLSWSPTWCATETAQGETPEQCARGRDLGFLLHGLWPQWADGGWPEFCETAARDPKRDETRAMADIMGSGGLAWYQWKKHGRCSGLSAEDYFTLSRRAFRSITLPDFTANRVTAAAVEQAFLDANPGLRSDDVIVDCAQGRVREARICLTPDLEPRACGPDVLRDACRTGAPLEMPPVP